MMLRWLRRRREARRLVQADAEALIRDYGPEDAGWAARGRRVARAVVRMTGKIVDYRGKDHTPQRRGPSRWLSRRRRGGGSTPAV